MQKKTMIPGEVSGVNPSAIRGPTGFWNEKTLPIIDWEAPEQRVVLPETLQLVLGIETPVVRWARSKYQDVVCRHTQPIEVRQRQNLTRHLASWELAGLQPGKYDTWHIFFREGDRWFIAVMGRNRDGDVTFITTYSPSSGNYLANVIRRGSYHRREDVEDR